MKVRVHSHIHSVTVIVAGLCHIMVATLTVMLTGIALTACGNHDKSAAMRDEIPYDEISKLKDVIKAAPGYDRDRRMRIDSIRKLYESAADVQSKFNLCLQLSDQNRNYNSDSALYYANRCAEIAAATDSKLMKQRSTIARIYALSNAGIFTRALPMLDNLEREGVMPQLRENMWLAGRTLYSYMRSYVEGQKEYYQAYNSRYLAYDDSLLKYLPASSQMRQFLECERMVTDGETGMARIRLEDLLSRVDDNENLYGMASFQMAEVYKRENDPKLYATYLARAASSDIKNSVREGIALPTLADWLYEHDEFSDAFAFINFSLEDAMKGQARMRAVSIAKMVPVIDAAYREKVNSSRDEMMIYFLLATFLFVLSTALLVVLFRSMKKIKGNEAKLNTLSNLQDSYIANFVALCATYSDRLDSLANTVSRKLSSGQGDELLKLVNSGKFTDNGNEKFFAMFDNAFLSIYPDFIASINALLRPDAQIESREDNTMSPELRIYAFVRLGVDESTRIAQILHYSVSTVYAYRNRMRNRAVQRDTFDADVMKISR